MASDVQAAMGWLVAAEDHIYKNLRGQYVEQLAIVQKVLNEKWPRAPKNISVDCLSQGCRRSEFEQMAYERDEQEIADARRQAVEEMVAHYRTIQARHPGVLVPWQAMYIQYGPAAPEDIARAKELFPHEFPSPAPAPEGGDG